jgi:triacylglycerol lipase
MTTRQKAIPPNKLEYTLPPNKEYIYFEDSNDTHFQYGAPDEFSLINAWWLAEAAFLAYAEPRFAKPRFQDAGLPNVGFFSGNSTQCYVAHNDNFVIVAFRGSESKEREDTSGCDIRYIIADWQADLRIELVDSGHGGSVHRGFKEALDEVWNSQVPSMENESLKSYLDRVSNENGRQRSVWFTGHSLGAALATLAAGRYGSAARLYTFGSPRVGDRIFADRFPVKSYRFVNNDDAVTKVPFPLSYRHVGNTRYIDNEGNILDDPSLGTRLVNNFLRVVRNVSDVIYLRLTRALPDNALSDHAPIYYAIRIWNAYDKTRQE